MKSLGRARSIKECSALCRGISQYGITPAPGIRAAIQGARPLSAPHSSTDCGFFGGFLPLSMERLLSVPTRNCGLCTEHEAVLVHMAPPMTGPTLDCGPVLFFGNFRTVWIVGNCPHFPTFHAERAILRVRPPRRLPACPVLFPRRGRATTRLTVLRIFSTSRHPTPGRARPH